MKLLADIAEDTTGLPRADCSRLKGGDFVAVALELVAILMHFEGWQRVRIDERTMKKARVLLCRRYSIDENGKLKKGLLWLEIDEKKILASGDKAFELLGIKKPEEALRKSF
jgi:hypothetical protein